MSKNKSLINNVVIVSAYRSPIGSFGGSLASLSPRELGSQILSKNIEQSKIHSKDIEQVYLGNVLSAGHGQNIARQVAIDSGISEHTPACTINAVCGSGLQSVILATQSIQLQESNLVVSGGVESMSQSAYVLPKERWGSRMGHGEVIDTMISDGLWDAYNDYHMGITAENIAEKWNISRKAQDAFALTSQHKASNAQEKGLFENEILPISIPQRKRDDVIFDQDEYIRKDLNIESLVKLKPAFKKDGSVTAGNASGLNDGAAIIILATEEYARANKLEILARVRAYNTIGLSPDIMGYGPAVSISKMSQEYGIDLTSVERFEINEAFAAQSLAVLKDLKLDIKKVNPHGGSISLGHPIGASGARILTTLLHGMKQANEHTGIASLCIGGGMGISMYIEM